MRHFCAQKWCSFIMIDFIFHMAIPIKCFVSHRPTDPIFSKSEKKNYNSLSATFSWMLPSLICFAYILKSLWHLNQPSNDVFEHLSEWYRLVSKWWSRGRYKVRLAWNCLCINLSIFRFSAFLSFFLFFPTDRPHFTRERAMGNKTVYGVGL